MLLEANVANVKFLMPVSCDGAEFIPEQGSKITPRPIKDINSAMGMTICGLVRGEERMLVSGNTQIESGDIVVVFFYDVDKKKVEKLFN